MNNKQTILEKFVFQGLTNLNDGFDRQSIKYFSKEDFDTILERVENIGIGIYGIEPWPNGEFAGARSYEDYCTKPSDPKWYRKAFSEFVKEGVDSHFAATYQIPAEFCL